MRTEAKKQSSPGPVVASSDLALAERYAKHAGEISLVMGSFFLRYLSGIYREFHGDLAMVIILGEVGHHNMSHCYSGQGQSTRVDRMKLGDPSSWRELRPCNAFSLSVSTGIPRETVRRKIKALVSKGWLKRNNKGEVFITTEVVQHFHSDFDPRLLRDLLAVAKRLDTLLYH